MKLHLTILAVLFMVATSCQFNSGDKHQGSHTHSDGTVHEGHGHDEMPDQIVFKVNGDAVETPSSCCGEAADSTACSGEKVSSGEGVAPECSEHNHNHSHPHGQS